MEARQKFWFSYLDNGSFPADFYGSRTDLQFIARLEEDVYLIVDSCEASYVVPRVAGVPNRHNRWEMNIPIMKAALDEVALAHDIRCLVRDMRTKPGIDRAHVERYVTQTLDATKKPFLKHVKECARRGERLPFKPISPVFPARVEAYCVAPGAQVSGCHFEGTSTTGIYMGRS